MQEMRPLPRWRKFFMRAHIAIATQSLVALFLILLFAKPHHLNWPNLAVFCVFYGVVMTVAAKSYAAKYQQSLGVSSPEQVNRLAAAVKNNAVPDDETLKKALPTYLERRLNSIVRQQKLVPFNIVLLGLFFLGSALARYLPSALLFGFMTGLSVYSHFSLKDAENKVIALQAKVGITTRQPLSESEARKQHERTVSVARSGAILAGILLIIILAESGSTSSRNDTNNIATNHSIKQHEPPVYTSSKDNFTIEYPGKPAITSYTYTPSCGLQSFPYNEYQSSVSNASEIYTIDVYNWPLQDLNFPSMSDTDHKATILKLINLDLQANYAEQVGIDKEIPGNSNPEALAVEVHYKIPGSEFTVYGYERVFTIGNTEYDLKGQFSDENELAGFDNFASTFQFTGKEGESNPKAATNNINLSCLAQNSDQSNTDTSSDTGSNSTTSGDTAEDSSLPPSPQDINSANSTVTVVND